MYAHCWQEFGDIRNEGGASIILQYAKSQLKRVAQLPGRPFHNSRASQSGYRRILCSWGTSYEGFWNSKIAKGSVGSLISFLVLEVPFLKLNSNPIAERKSGRRSKALFTPCLLHVRYFLGRPDVGRERSKDLYKFNYLPLGWNTPISFLPSLPMRLTFASIFEENAFGIYNWEIFSTFLSKSLFPLGSLCGGEVGLPSLSTQT